ncbi:MAG TPA: hypothetical protein VNI58_08660 [Mariprofundaceae bacterium]|nr:hypothetical protein [Mariprofundaceae bacterium]
MNSEHESVAETSATDRDGMLRLAIAAATLGMTMGISVGDVLAAPPGNNPPSQATTQPSNANQATSSSATPKKPDASYIKSGRPDANYLKAERPAAVYDKARK